jgi:alpha-ketoglutarate-dependent taurine dioxygenase
MHVLKLGKNSEKFHEVPPGIVIEDREPPSVDWDEVLSALRDFVDPQGKQPQGLRSFLTESSINSELRLRLMKQFPSLVALRNQFTEAAGRSAHLIRYRSLGVAGMDPDEQAACFAIICLMFGKLLAADKPTGQVVWDVKNREVKSPEYSTFSEGQKEANFHTDTAFYETPVRYFGLYCRHAAGCGGGTNRFCNALALRRLLDNDPDLSWISRKLASQPAVFRVPFAFTRNGGTETVTAKVFGEEVPIRLRRDSLVKGLELTGDSRTSEILAAVDAFLALAQRPENHIEMSLAEDSAVFVNNHELLHYRSSFVDPQRHLLRVWIQF